MGLCQKRPKKVSEVSRETVKCVTLVEIDIGSTLFESDPGKIKSLFSNEKFQSRDSPFGSRCRFYTETSPENNHLYFNEDVGRSFPSTYITKYICFGKGRCKISSSSYS